MIPSCKQIYLVQPDLSKRAILNGVQTDTVDFHPQAKGYSELSFDVDRFINVDGELIESNGYEDLKPSMYLYLEDIGYFIMETPEVSMDGNKEIKSIVAFSAEKEFEFKDLSGIKINCGTPDSIEYSYTDESNKELVDGKYEFAIQYVSMYNPQNTHLSFLHLILEKMSSKWMIQYVSPKLMASSAQSVETTPKFKYKNNNDISTKMKLSEIRNIVYNSIRQYRDEAIRLIDGYDTGVFGNVDLNNRQTIVWTRLNLNKYSFAQTEYGVESGDYSTVLGQYQTYNSFGLSIAFSPLLQVANQDEPVLLQQANIGYYLSTLLQNANSLDSENIQEKIFELDKNGFPNIVDQYGHVIKNIVAGVSKNTERNNSAEIISIIMHYREANEDSTALQDYIYPYITNIFSKENVTIVDYSKLPALEIDNENLYAIMTSDVAPRMNCIFIFDYLNFGINVYHKDELDFNTSIFTSFRNLQTQLNISVDTDSIYTKFTVAGDGDLEFRDYNYGDNTIIDLSYFLGEPYLEDETVNKYNKWIAIREKYREQYMDLAIEYDTLLETKSQKLYAQPSDGSSWETWQNISKEGLDKNLEYYKKYLETLQISVDTREISEMYDSDNNYIPKKINGEVDHQWYEDKLYERVNVYGGYYTYKEIVKYIIPYIEMALRNINVVDDYKETPEIKINEDWEMYGLKELEGIRESFLEQMEALDRYSKAWDEMDDEEKKQKRLDYITDENGTQYEELQGRKDYKHYKEQLGDEDTPGTVLYFIKKLEDEIVEIDERLEELNNITNDYAIVMKYNLTTDELNNITRIPTNIKDERRPTLFNEDELLAIDTLIRETDYTNSNILITSIMSISDKFREEKNLYDDAADKLYEVAQPQYKFSVSLDNFFRLIDYEAWAEEFQPNIHDAVPFGLLKFIHVELRDGYYVKLRVIGYRWNPCEITPDLTLEFSNMITGRSGRSDLTELIESENNRGSKNSIKIGNGSAQDQQEYAQAIMELLQNNALFNRTVAGIASGTVGGVDAETVSGIIYSTPVPIMNVIGSSEQLAEFVLQGISNMGSFNDEYIAAKIIEAGEGFFGAITIGTKDSTTTIANGVIKTAEINAKQIIGEQGDFDTLTAGVFSADTAEINQLMTNKINALNITAGEIDVKNIKGDAGDFDTFFVNNFHSDNANIQNLISDSITASTVAAKIGDFQQVDADTIFANQVFANAVSAQSIASLSTTTGLDAVKNLLANNIFAININGGTLTLTKDMIIKSDDENNMFVLNNHLLQFQSKKVTIQPDGSEKVEYYPGIQIGYVNQNENEIPHIIIRDENGAMLFTSQGMIDDNGDEVKGIAPGAITDGLIVNDMIHIGTIDKNRLNFNVLSDESEISLQQIYVDGHQFGSEWTTFKEKVEGLDELMVYPTVELVGDQVFVDSNGIISPGFIIVDTVLRNGAVIDKWYINDNEVTDSTLFLNNKTQLIVRSSLVEYAKTVSVKVQCTNANAYDIITLYKVTDGKDTYRVVITSSEGELFKEQTTTTCTCTVYYGSNVVTPKSYEWEIKQNDGTWNKVRGNTRSINVNIANYLIKQSVRCTVEV